MAENDVSSTSFLSNTEEAVSQQLDIEKLDELETVTDSLSAELSERLETVIQLQADHKFSCTNRELIVNDIKAVRKTMMEISAVMKDCADMKQECDAEKRKLSARISELKDLKDSVKNLVQEKVKAMKLEVNDKRAKMAAEERQIQNEIAARTDKNAELRKKKEILSKEVYHKKTKIAENKRLSEISDRLKRKLRKVKEERNFRDEQLAAKMKQESEEIEQLKLILTDHNNLKEQKMAELKILQREINEQIADKEEKIAKLHSDNLNIEEECKLFEARIEESNKSFHTMNQLCLPNNIQQEINITINEIEDTKSELESKTELLRTIKSNEKNVRLTFEKLEHDSNQSIEKFKNIIEAMKKKISDGEKYSKIALEKTISNLKLAESQLTVSSEEERISLELLTKLTKEKEQNQQKIKKMYEQLAQVELNCKFITIEIEKLNRDLSAIKRPVREKQQQRKRFFYQ